MDEDEEFMLDQMKKYRPALAEFRVSRSYWKSRIPDFASYSMLQQHTEIRPYEKILFRLHDRPGHLEFNLNGDPDEFADFCDALEIAWRLLPDAWIGLQMMIDYLAEQTLSSDLAQIKVSTLNVLKEIAKTRQWPNNPFLGPMMIAGQAKTVLARVTRNASFSEATTVPVVRAYNGVTEPSQPSHRKLKGANLDRRKTCSRPECYEVEEAKAFKRCSRCRKVRYCSRDCQTNHWKEHKVCTDRKRR